MVIRSFLAFELPAGIREIVSRVAGEVRDWPLDVKWVKAGNIHLTVIFLGDVRAEDIPSIGEVVRGVCLDYGPFQASLRGMGAFPNPRKPRVLWLGLDGDLERMAAFRDALQGALGPFGIAEEKRRFRPHLTLGRFRRFNQGDLQVGAFVFKYLDLTSQAGRLEEIVLFRSDLKPGGAVYRKLGSWALTGER